jgi:hypothetical protein
MIHARSHRAEPECYPPASQDPGPKGCRAAALGLEELEGRYLQTQQEEEAPAAIQGIEILCHLVQVGQARCPSPRLRPPPQSQLMQPMSLLHRLPSLPLFRLRLELHPRRRRLLR